MSIRKHAVWLQVSVREIKRMTSRRLYLYITLIFPLLSYLMFTSLFSEGLPKELPIAVVDKDHTSLSRKLTRTLDASEMSRVTMQLSTAAEAQSEMRKGNIYGYVVWPDHFQADILAGRSPEVGYFFQNSVLIVGGLMQKDLATTLNTISAAMNIQKREAMGQGSAYIWSQVQPVKVDTHLLFNPQANYSVYLSTTLLPAMLQLFILIMTVYAIGVEIKQRTSREWLRLSDNSILVALIGKLLPYTVLFSLLAILQNCWLFGFLHMPLNTNLGSMMLASVMYVLSYQALGIFIVGTIPVLRDAISIASLYAALAMTFSGLTFPIEGMPELFQYWAKCFPIRHYLNIYINQALNGFGLTYSWFSYVSLLLFILLPFTVIMRLKGALIYQQYIEK